MNKRKRLKYYTLNDLQSTVLSIKSVKNKTESTLHDLKYIVSGIQSDKNKIEISNNKEITDKIDDNINNKVNKNQIDLINNYLKSDIQSNNKISISKNKIYSCIYCPENEDYSGASGLWYHMKKVHGKKSRTYFKKKIIKKKKKSKNKLNNYEINLVRSIFKSGLDKNKVLISKNRKTRKTKKKRKSDKLDKYKCKICMDNNTTYSGVSGLWYHMKRFHNMSTKKYNKRT